MANTGVGRHGYGRDYAATIISRQICKEVVSRQKSSNHGKHQTLRFGAEERQSKNSENGPTAGNRVADITSSRNGLQLSQQTSTQRLDG